MTILELLKRRRDEIVRIAQKHGAHNVRVFGSVVRGETNSDSDIDFLVEMERGRSLIDLVELNDELEEALQKKVDVVTDGGVSPFLKARIYAEAVSL